MVIKLEDAVNKHGWGKDKVKFISLSGWVIMNENKELFTMFQKNLPSVWPTKKGAQMIELMNLKNGRWV